MTTPTLATHTLRAGFGPPIMLLHAFPVDHRMWTELAAALPGAPTVLAVDLPGLGDSPLPIARPSIEAAADGVAKVLGSRRPAVVAGVSMGGYVALALAERRPELVAGLGLIDTKSTPDTPEAQANRLRIADAVDRAQTVDPVLAMAGTLIGPSSRARRPGLTAQVEAWIRGQRPAGVAWSQRAMAAREDRTAVLEEFAGPVLVAVGQEDQLTPLAEAEHMAAAAKDAHLERVAGAGHLSVVELPEALAEAIGSLAARAR